MWILEVLGILFLLGGLVITAAFYAAFITGLFWMLFTGIEIVTAPVISCTGCFDTVFDSKPLGWMLISFPALVFLAFITHRFFGFFNTGRKA